MEGKSALEQRIIQKARSIAADILKKENDQAERMLDEVRREGEKALADALQKAKDRGGMIRKEYEASGQLEARLLLLKKREELIDQVLERAVDLLKEKTGRAEYRDVAAALVLEGVEALELEEAVVVLGKSEKRVLDRDIAAVAKGISATLGRPVQLTLSDGSLNSLGGVKVMDKERHLLYDNTWTARLARIRPQLGVEISEILFSGRK